MPARTSWTSARHRSTDWGHLQASCGISWCPMICRLPADYKESANFKGHGPTPASGRSSWFVHDWLQIDVAANPTNTFSYVWSVLHARSDQKSPDYAWQFCFIFSANLPSNVRYYPWNRGDRTTSFWWNVFIYRIPNKRRNQVLTLGPKWLGPTWPTCPNFPYGAFQLETRKFQLETRTFQLETRIFRLETRRFLLETRKKKKKKKKRIPDVIWLKFMCDSVSASALLSRLEKEILIKKTPQLTNGRQVNVIITSPTSNQSWENDALFCCHVLNDIWPSNLATLQWTSVYRSTGWREHRPCHHKVAHIQS